MSQLTPSFETHLTNLAHKYRTCAPEDFIAMSQELSISTARAEWLRSVASRLAVGEFETLGDVPQAELAAILKRDVSSDSVEIDRAHVEVIIDVFGGLTADELRARAHQPGVHDSLANDLLRWAAKLEHRERRTLRDVPEQSRVAVVS